MKINPSVANNATRSTGVSSASPADRAAQAKKKTIDTSSTKPEISDKAKDMAQARAIAQSAPEVRDDKIAALKARIADGSYKVDAQKVADRLVDEHLETASLE